MEVRRQPVVSVENENNQELNYYKSSMTSETTREQSLNLFQRVNKWFTELNFWGKVLFCVSCGVFGFTTRLLFDLILGLF